MFERLEARAKGAAERRAGRVAEEMAEQLRSVLPGGVTAEKAPEGVRLIGRGLWRRYVLDAALREILSGRRR